MTTMFISPSTVVSIDAPSIRWRRAGSGLVVSLMLHAILFLGWQGWQARQLRLAPVPRVIELRLQPAKLAPPPPAIVPVPVVEPIATAAPAAVRPAKVMPTPARSVPTARITTHRQDEEKELAPVETTPHSPPIQADLVPAKPAAGHIDLEAARRIARAVGQEGRKEGPPAFLAKPEAERETPLAKGIAKSERSDCRDAYAGYGLLAAPLLLKDAATGKGCKW
ncbi:hypothetical protein [Chitinivorax sp. B]|uniref:hypothetical protein n=1 Tax=Chitinivorax sp. B TaxID=2502235 RepID=UPI0010F98F19|nr:hypothetical protein [Chitinivorax sp. B]